MTPRRLPATALVCLAVGLTTSASAQSPRPDKTVPQEVILQVVEGQSAQAVAATHSLTLLDQFGSRPIWRARVATGAKVKTVVQALDTDARVQYAEAHVEHQTPEGRHNVVWAIGGSQAEWAEQWAPQAMRLPLAHQRATGDGVTVALLDTGVDLSHPILASRLLRDGNGAVKGRDFVDGDNDPSEVGSTADPGYGHGTHVAGLIALAAPDARLMPARVLTPAGQGNVWVLAEALMWAVDPDGNPATDDGAQVINLSLGTTRKTNFLDQVIGLITCSDDDDDDDGGGAGSGFGDPGFEEDKQRCDGQGGSVVISAAGNEANTQPIYPAAEQAEGALSVAAATSSHRLADFSSRGSWVQIAAPGDQIISTVPGNQWAVWSGTSMAAPLVSGVAALLREANPDWKAVDVTKRITDRSAKMCGTPLRRVDAAAAVLDREPVRTRC
jgi:subtilisin family serine protease